MPVPVTPAPRRGGARVPGLVAAFNARGALALFRRALSPPGSPERATPGGTRGPDHLRRWRAPRKSCSFLTPPAFSARPARSTRSWGDRPLLPAADARGAVAFSCPCAWARFFLPLPRLPLAWLLITLT